MGDCTGRVTYTKTGLIKFKTLLHAHIGASTPSSLCLQVSALCRHRMPANYGRGLPPKGKYPIAPEPSTLSHWPRGPLDFNSFWPPEKINWHPIFPKRRLYLQMIIFLPNKDSAFMY